MTDAPKQLPEKPDLDWLRKHAKARLDELLATQPEAQLSDAQFALAKEYGFSSWRALKAHVDAKTLEGQLLKAIADDDLAAFTALIDAHPDALSMRSQPYEWTLLHAAAEKGRLAIVDLLLRRGLDVNTREKGDNTYAMHWAAAAGHADVVQRLVDAGGDVIGHGDDHALEVIGWATCWDGCDDDRHREVVKVLLAHGARHHIFSAMSMHLPDEMRRIAAERPAELEQTLSHNEDFQRPLHFAARRHLLDEAKLLVELGANPWGTDESGYTALAYALTPEMGRVLRAAQASRPGSISDREAQGALHLAAKQGDVPAVHALIAAGADPNARWPHWDSDLTALHLAVLGNHPEVVRTLLAAGADSAIKDSKHDADPLGWAEFFQRREIAELIKNARAR